MVNIAMGGKKNMVEDETSSRDMVESKVNILKNDTPKKLKA